MKNINYGDRVILIDHKSRRHMVKLKETGRFSSQYGFIEHSDIVEAGDGGTVKTNKNFPYRIFSTTYTDYVMNLKRNAQIIYPKDTAQMLMEADIYPGLNVLESGIGQGALSMALLRALGNKGRLTTYEIREDFAEQSKNFIDDFCRELTEIHDIRIGNIYEGFEGIYERILLDVPEPWHVIEHTKNGLVGGGIIVSYIPTILQVKTYVDTLKATGYFDDLSTFEIIKRPWKIDGLSVRPEMWMYNHSAFIVKARKTRIS
ncbi:MAG TPA: tRNA (adenine-N1)-methyltransferase [Flexistipes sinusarabici]|uniref:tRNA (adenine(58)-N(1))-methyltransferase TrmI n=1 Tax=Flexistipes sinusarabici TaxID=2352 RepID=A0A3D5QFU8_FLESI|nr:tRNA (adenine-N1)-methyltransferase [Flexistipes sinusarabici]